MSFIERSYKFLNNEKSEIVCTGISDEACQKIPENYFRNIGMNLFTQLSDTFSNPKTILTWLMLTLSVPTSIISFIVPIRESGSMIPQIILAEFLKNKPKRKKIWIIGALIQSFTLIGIGLIGLTLTGIFAGLSIILLLIIFSLGRSLCSLTSKDIIGKTIPKSRRGKLTGYANGVSGILILIFGIFIGTITDISWLSSIVIGAGLLWIVAVLIYQPIFEPDGFVDNSAFSLKSMRQKLSLLQKDNTLRKFIIARSMLLCSALTSPFYIILSQEANHNNPQTLGLFILGTGIAGIISAPFWGIMSDISSRMVIFRAAILAAALGVLSMLSVYFFPMIELFSWLYPAIVFILTIAHNGIRIGRKTYIIDIAEGDCRTDYVSISNTVIGVILLIVGAITSLLSLISVPFVILFLSFVGFVGAYFSYKLPEASNFQKA